MYLKALEIQGFKSFPDKVRLNFEKKLTAIVGPNGSGKSNISDAICWVMGEQSSKALRGAKMEDVIFGGNGQRAGASFAQVSLVIDNSEGLLKTDSREVMITRRFYKSGESEYFINKAPVRLKDVNELLMDTGLGRDGYSVIGQGRVDEILSAKSTDRREVFEEAAGISRFRYRKEEAQRKIEKTEESLLRVNDKIAELEHQVAPLKKQAETAKRYLLLRDELRGLEISLWMDSLDRIKERLRLIGGECGEAAERLEEEKKALEGLYAASEDSGAKMRELDLRADELRGEASGLEGEAARLEGEAALRVNDAKNAALRVESLRRELAERESRDGELRERIAARAARLAATEGELEKLAAEKARLAEAAAAAEAEAEGLKLKLEALLSEAAGEESLAAAAEARISAIRDSGRSRKQRDEAAEAERRRLAGRLREEEESLDRLSASIAELEEAVRGAENSLGGFRLRAEARRKRLGEAERSLKELKEREGGVSYRISVLEGMQRELEGFSGAVREILGEKKRGSLRGIHGAVADLIKTVPKYALAVETALGASLQSIVVDREEDAKAAIEHLKRRNAGRATFLPLSVIKPNELNERGLAGEEGAEGLASELVSCEDRYKSVVSNLLGRTVVAEDLDSAIRLSRKYSARFRIVTLDGQIINAGGSMTGGSSARNAGILSRAGELERLRAELKGLSARAAEAGRALAEAERELAAAEFEGEAAEAELRSLQDELIRLRAEAGQRKLLRDSVKESLEAAERARAEAEAGLAESEAALAEAEAEAGRRRRAAAGLRREAERLIGPRRETEERLARLRDGLGSAGASEASLRAEASELSRGIKELEGLLRGFGGETEGKLLEIKELEASIGALEASASEKRAEAEALRRRAEAARGRLAALTEEKLACEAGKTRAEKEAQEKSRLIIELERRYAEINQRKLACEAEEKQLVDKLWDSYELNRSSAQKLRLELESVPKAARRVAELRRELAALGSPNLGAIEEYERVSERYAFLTEQRDDIEKAKKELQALVNGITAEMEKLFAAEFRAIAEKFSETFAELFGGGRAELILEDEKDILNCGIEIKIQPPGKTARSLSLLSGGERAFVAIALYFAILKVRPTPFCVLDEIEAALDEVNVARFAEYIRKMSESTQFLVITHRRGTMEEADELYGVTMQKGISKVLSVEPGKYIEK